MNKEIKQNQALNTEEKIKEAAKALFQKQGFSGTKTRDIAEAAGINHALLNYYFRSKQKLYQIIMEEAMQKVMPTLIIILNEKDTSIEEKVEKFVAHYIDLNIENKNLTFFLISNIQSEGGSLPLIKQFNYQAKDSYFFKQYQEYVASNKIPKTDPLQLLFNILGLVIFPFITRYMFESDGIGLTQEKMEALIIERKKLIPIWIKQMLGMP